VDVQALIATFPCRKFLEAVYRGRLQCFFVCVPLQCCGKLLTLASRKMEPVSGLNTIDWVLSVVFIVCQYVTLLAVTFFYLSSGT
jgi:hypothetical protein